MEAFRVATGIVALGEMGDKTQLRALLLAARFKKPVPIILGILVATLANHAAAGWLGGWIAGLMGPQLLRWVMGGSFLAMAVWMLIPDRLDDAAAAGWACSAPRCWPSFWPRWVTRRRSPPWCWPPATPTCWPW